jgi:hypothetical protein
VVNVILTLLSIHITDPNHVNYILLDYVDQIIEQHTLC